MGNFADNTAPVVTPVASGTFQKAEAFINIYLPSASGEGKRKLGTIKLYNNKAAEAPLIAWLKEDPSRVTRLLETAIVDFQTIDGNPASGFALPE